MSRMLGSIITVVGLTVTLAYCADNGASNAARVATPESAIVGDPVHYSDQLPATARYGWIDFTLVDAVLTDEFEALDAIYRPGDERYAVFSIEATSLHDDAAVNVWLGMIRLEVDGEVYFDVRGRTLEVPTGGSAAGPLVFAVPPGTDLGDAILVIDERTSYDEEGPAYLSLDGEDLNDRV